MGIADVAIDAARLLEATALEIASLVSQGIHSRDGVGWSELTYQGGKAPNGSNVYQ